MLSGLHGCGGCGAAAGVSPQWLTERVRRREVPHQRYGRRTAFTPAQLDSIRSLYAVPVADPTTATLDAYTLAVASGATSRSRRIHASRAIQAARR